MRAYWPSAAMLLVVPASLLGGGTSAFGRLAVAAAVAVLALVTAVLTAARTLPLRRPQLLAAVMAGLLLISFLFPQVTSREALPPETSPPGGHHVVEVLRMFRALTPIELSRLSDLGGLLTGLALLAVSTVWSPRPSHLTRVIAVTGTVAAGYVLVRGHYTGGRLEGLGCNANYLGIVLAVPIVAAMGLVRSSRSARWLLPAAVCFVEMVDTQSRGAFAAAAAGVAFSLFQGRSLRVQALIASIAVSLGAGAVVAGRSAQIGHLVAGLGAGDRTTTDLSFNNGVRGQVAELALRVIAEHPLRGIGYWMFPTYAERAPGFGQYLTTHNEYLRLGAEAGLPTLAVFLYLLWLGARSGRGVDLAVPQAVVVAYGVAFLFANPLASLVISAPFWVSLGCLLSRSSGVPDETASSAGTADWMQGECAPQPP